MVFTPYLNFKGQCADAFALYAKVFGGTIQFIQKFGDSPMNDQTPAEWRDKVMHATLAVGGQALMGSDPPPQHYVAPKGIAVSIELPSFDEARRVFTALAEGGQTSMPFSKTFWSEGFGMTTDRFGIPWMVGVASAAV